MALYIKFVLPCDSGQDIFAHAHCPKEVTLAYCTGGHATFGPCWPEVAHQTMDLLLGGPESPQNLSGQVRSHALKASSVRLVPIAV